MARPWAEYDLNDWLRLRPLLHRWKTFWLDRANARYVRTPGDPAELARARAALAGRNPAVAIAFNTPHVIAAQQRLAHRNLADTSYAVVDNSSDEAAAAEMRALCEAGGTPYVRAPANPSASASRSHGFALNWAWHNLVRPLRPRLFVFLDHDMMPVRPYAFAPILERRPFYGRLVQRGPRYYLWAGFCAFDFAAVGHLPLDFRQHWFAGLDTGGANWDVLYSAHDVHGVEAISGPVYESERPGDPAAAVVEWYGEVWLHVGNASGWAPIEAGKPAFVDRVLARYL